MPSAPQKTKSFRLQTKYVFLTYPRCSSSAENLRDFLWDKLSRFAIFFIAIATELHQDGTPHLHCLIQLDKRSNIRDPSFFDLEGNHPNIQPAKNSEQVLEYISKDGNVITKGEFKKHRVSPSKSDERWRTIIQTATSKEEYLDMIKDEFPHEWATKLQWLEYSANKLFPPQPEIYQATFTEEDLQCHEDLQLWRDQHLYHVSVDAYRLVHNVTLVEAHSDLVWMDDISRNLEGLEPGSPPSTSADQVVPERQHGPEASEGTITGMGPSTSLSMMTTRPTTSSTTSPSNSSHSGSN
ncbi:replication-associated protein [Tobacco yellow dwarf virus]|uniref:Replication-associated protein A n=2 Tax=Tobacco yellow dwarf virus TaxID=10830 RepID=REPA_TYDVA|nr:replication-associated protein [Tobacco yellow dwarf virus]P31617.1 RecName: Full=Replication-associated protein A; Short=RepA [Tobacco yellow dwarf virus (strain Australia)]AAA47950.1 C1 [Tobacco yellow dwarf virus]AFD63067.1 RepA protein [Tobacco yellow dwarf virus-A]BDB72840.1 replication-associated protein [Tobacco yellow dwarf virus]